MWVCFQYITVGTY